MSLPEKEISAGTRGMIDDFGLVIASCSVVVILEMAKQALIFYSERSAFCMTKRAAV